MLIDPEKDATENTNLANDPKYADVVEQLSGLVKRYAAGHTPE